MQLRYFTILIILLAFCTLCKGQDGSDIRYYNTSDLDSSFIGKEVHLDFYHNSFGGLHIDTITINVDGTPIRFLEHRQDDGFNNWFSQQYLKGLDTLNSIEITIASWIILNVSKDSIQVRPNFGLRFPKETLISVKSFKETYWFHKTTITQILVKSKQFGT